MLFTIMFVLVLGGWQGTPSTPFAQHNPLALRATTPDRAEVPRYGKLELTLNLSATYQNPFDPEEVDVYALFTSPQGKTIRINGFLDQPFTRKLVAGQEQVEAAGPPVWKVRFAPDTVGTWRYR